MKIKNHRLSMFINVVYNIISSAMVVAVIQLLIFPTISRQVSVDKFGVIVAVYGFKNLFVNVFGNTLNNVRLINTESTSEQGNFNRLGIWAILIVTTLSLPLYLVYGINELTLFEIIVLFLSTLISTLRYYLMVYFRYNLNYSKILLTNIFISIGLVAGLGVNFLINLWPIIFLFGEGFGLLYLLKNTPILTENIQVDGFYEKVKSDYFNLTLSNGIVTCFSYLDRFFIVPMLGSVAMSVYFSVSVTAKFIGMLVTPFTNVLLSYINRSSSKNSYNNFKQIIGLSTLIFIPTYFILNLITPLLILLLYPDFYTVSLDYIWIVNLFTVISLLTSILNPFLIKFVSLKNQVSIQSIYGIFYFFSSLFLSTQFGLIGFCYATLGSYLLKLLLTIVIGLRKLREVTYE